MPGKMIKAAIISLVAVMLLSTLLPGGGSSGVASTTDMKELYEFEEGSAYRSPNYVPEINFEMPKTTFKVEGENGEWTTIMVPWGSDKNDIEDMISEKIKGEPYEDDIKDIDCGLKAPLSEKESKNIILVDRFHSGSLEGYLFCEINEPLNFDASYLAFGRERAVYEWDIDNDGNYDNISLFPKMSHVFSEMGLYTLRIKVTYSYNYTYYPWCGDDIFYITPDSKTQVFVGENIQTTSFLYSPRRYTTTILKESEYEIKVSVGSKESGYPSILRMELQGEGEDTEVVVQKNVQPPEYRIKNVDESNFYSIPIPVAYDNMVIYPIVPQEWINSTIVLVKDVHDIQEIKEKFDDCTVRFDASDSGDINEGSDYIWDFGDGGSARGMIVDHTFAYRGTYTATLRVAGWNVSLLRTFDVQRGGHEPKRVWIWNSFDQRTDGILFCDGNEPMIFDIEKMVGYNSDIDWIEWDFNNDLIFEENRTETWVKRSFDEPGYYQINFRYTYSYEDPWNIAYDFNQNFRNSPSTNYVYRTHMQSIKVIVMGEQNGLSFVPDFTIIAPETFSWWNQMNRGNSIDYRNLQKNVTYLRCNAYWNSRRLNSWRNPVSFSALPTILPTGSNYADCTFSWDFGDGTTGTGITIEHEFETNGGNYPVTLTVERGSLNLSITKTVAPRPYSPNIYLYRDKPAFDIVRVIVDGKVTKTVPSVPLGSEIMWDNVLVTDGKLLYRNKEYDFLYYEELLNEPKTSEFGWILERNEQGRLFLNDKGITLEKLKDHFRGEMKKAGLFRGEIEDFIDEWLGEGGRLFPGKQSFRYAIMYIPEDDINEVIQIKTARTYHEIIRFHLLIQPAEKGVWLKPPKYKEHERFINALHEWGVYSGNSVLRNTVWDVKTTGFDILCYGNADYQMDYVWSYSIGEKEHITFDPQSLPLQAPRTRSQQAPSSCSQDTGCNPSFHQVRSRNLQRPS